MTREEAIEVYHGLLNQKIKEAFEVFVPELRESENERIRNKIVSAMSYYRNDGCISEYEFGVCRNWIEKQKEQKPAEWSKNDTVFLNEIIDFFEDKTAGLQHDLEMYAHWFKSLPERFNLQPKNGWSEEDEEMFDEALAGVLLARNRMNDTGCIGLAERFEKAYKWLESFRPRPHWKPSEEQMRALKIARSFVVDDFSENPTLSEILKALYEQLKKLM